MQCFASVLAICISLLVYIRKWLALSQQWPPLVPFSWRSSTGTGPTQTHTTDTEPDHHQCNGHHLHSTRAPPIDSTRKSTIRLQLVSPHSMSCGQSCRSNSKAVPNYHRPKVITENCRNGINSNDRDRFINIYLRVQSADTHTHWQTAIDSFVLEKLILPQFNSIRGSDRATIGPIIKCWQWAQQLA